MDVNVRHWPNPGPMRRAAWYIAGAVAAVLLLALLFAYEDAHAAYRPGSQTAARMAHYVKRHHSYCGLRVRRTRDPLVSGRDPYFGSIEDLCGRHWGLVLLSSVVTGEDPMSAEPIEECEPEDPEVFPDYEGAAYDLPAYRAHQEGACHAPYLPHVVEGRWQPPGSERAPEGGPCYVPGTTARTPC
jgi:hypothetical protein